MGTSRESMVDDIAELAARHCTLLDVVQAMTDRALIAKSKAQRTNFEKEIVQELVELLENPEAFGVEWLNSKQRQRIADAVKSKLLPALQ